MTKQKKMKLAAAAAMAVSGLSGLAAYAAPGEIAILTLTVNTTAKTWSAFEQNSDPSQTSGFAGAQFSVTGAGGIVVSGSTLKMPQGLDGDGGGVNGFTVLTSNGTNGASMSGYQATSYSVNAAGDVTNVYLGVGNVAEHVNVSDDGSGDGGVGDAPGVVTTKAIALPALIATGTYTGTSGSLTINAVPTAVEFLPVSMPTPTQQGVPYQSFAASGVTPETLMIGPEPTSLALFGIGVGGLLLRRRKQA